MRLKHPETIIRNYSEKIDNNLNQIYLIKDEEVKFQYLVDLLESIEGWRTAIDEIELSVKSNHVFTVMENNEHDIDDENKEIIIY
jgi:hypothetical protein